ncbi:CLUMA_CG009467, isoform A [Clunio marinus]|uniref:CLUMA_CG009467, isoform A n=1 Tax=Clunio marinus TaxID=568069 RepID=A0A1J1I8Z0_9DIPT|nr:CLUMA_CG009467, isoform A [Clunio marinus]
MEEENQKPNESSDKVDDNNENVKGNDGNKSGTEMEKAKIETDDINIDQEAGTSTNASKIEASKPPSRRNYRRHTGDSDDDSSSEPNTQQEEPPADLPESNQPQPISDSEDVSLDELRVSVSEEDNNHNARSSDSSDSDSSFSFGSRLSPLIRFGVGSRRMFADDDTDSNGSSDEEVVDKAKRLTRDIMSKDSPLHNSVTWPKILMNRESGYFCKRNESRFANHRKVFERNFYGSLNSVQRLELMAKLNEHVGCVNCLGFSKNGLYLLSGSDDLRIILWNWYNNKPLTIANSKHRKNIFQCKFYEENGSTLKVVSASADGSVSLHNFSSSGGHTEKQIYNHHGAVHKIAVTDNVVYTCGEDALIMEMDFRTKAPSKLTIVREKHRKIPLFSIFAHPLEMKYVVSGRDQFIRVYDRRNQKEVLSRHCPTELLERNTTARYISCCVFNYNGTEILGSFNDENIYLFDTNNHNLGSYLHNYQGHVNSQTIKGVNFYGPKSEFIVSGSDCSNIFFWHKETEAIVQWMRGDENGIVNVLEPHPIYPVLATSGLDKDVKIWMPSNEDFDMNVENLESCIQQNMKNQIEASRSATFSLDPTIIQLARRFFQRSHRETVSPNTFANTYHSSDESSSSSP